MKKIQSFKYNECREEQMTIATLSSNHEFSESSVNYPLHRLRNLAIQGVQTTHVVPLDIRMWPSVELYETLNTPSVVRELSKNPHLAIVLPSFEVDMKKCSSHKKCIKHIPPTFESLVMKLSDKSVDVMDPLDNSRQGSTLYRSWVKQSNGELVDIDCVSSNYYEPFLAVRYCESLPPFQEVFRVEADDTDEGLEVGTKDDLTSTWTLHLLRIGYSLKQIGGAFLVNIPREKKANTGPDTSGDAVGSKSRVSHLRKTNHQVHRRADFVQWLGRTIPDRRVVQKCDDFEASEDAPPPV